MEEFLILILQAVAQFLFELLAYWPWDIWWWDDYERPPYREGERDWSFAGWMFLALMVGAAVGWVSLYVFPDVLVKWGWLRMALLAVTPLGSAFLAKTMAEARRTSDSLEDPHSHFWFSLCFSIGLVWVRFAFAHRPG